MVIETHWEAIMRFIIGFIWLAIAMLMTTGCGFHLRGAGVKNLPPIYIDGGNQGEGIRMKIERILHGSRNTVTASREQSKIVLQLTREDYQRRPLSISRQLLVQEYELIYTVDFQVNDFSGKPLSSPQSLTFTRDYSFSDTGQVLGKGNEEALLRQEMLQDASRQILAQIVTILERQDFVSPEPNR
ncbi:LPS-assembly lipoprotein LptE [Gammaproteobacteria bacterium]